MERIVIQTNKLVTPSHKLYVNRWLDTYTKPKYHYAILLHISKKMYYRLTFLEHSLEK